MPSPIKALCACVLRLPHMTLTFTSWPPLLKYSALFWQKWKWPKKVEKAIWPSTEKILHFEQLKLFLCEAFQSWTHTCAHRRARTSSRERQSLPRGPERNEGSQKLWHWGPVLQVASGIGGAWSLGVSVRRFAVIALQLVNYMSSYKSVTSLPSVSALALVVHLVSHLLRAF